MQVGPDKVKMEFMRWAVSKISKQGSGHVAKASVDDYDEVSDAEKQEASEEEVTAIKNAILNACENCDLVTVEEKFAQLKKIKLPPELSSKMQELSKAIENIEFDEIAYIFSR